MSAATRSWTPGYPFDLPGLLGQYRRGAGDPSWSRTPDGIRWAVNTAAGPSTLHVRADGDTVHATAHGDGAAELLDTLPALLGADDDDSGFVAHHELVTRVLRTKAVRLAGCGRIWDVLLAAILEQKVTGREAWRSWRELCRRHGSPAPGAPGLFTPPSPRQVLGITDWEWHRSGVDGARRRAIIAAAQVAHRLERAAELRGEAGRELLCKVPGIGVWTAAEVAQRAWGDPDAVSVGDYHLASQIGYALTGAPADDDGMLALLAPYAPQRHRAVRYILAAGVFRERRGPRYEGRNYRAL